jgi:hypothetical protein
VTIRAKLAWRKGAFAGKNRTRDKAGRKASRQPIGLKRWKNPAEQNRKKVPSRQRAERPEKGKDNHERHGSVGYRTATTSGKQRNAEGGQIRVGRGGYRDCHELEHQGSDYVEG